MTDRPSRRAGWSILLEILGLVAAVLIAFEVGSRAGHSEPARAASSDSAKTSTVLGLPEGAERLADRPGWTPPAKVVVQDLWPGRTAEIARVAPGVRVVVTATDSAFRAEIVDADAALGWVDRTAWERAKKLRWVQAPSAGIGGYLALPGMKEGDVVLTNAQRIYAEGGGEHVMAMALALARRLPQALELQRAHRWDYEGQSGAADRSGSATKMVELHGKTLLVAGLGGIGTEVARIGKGLGMRVVATRNSGRSGPPFVDYVGLSDELPKLAAEADVVVDCLPLTSATAGVFDQQLFDAMKPGAYFVNIGRGGTVVTDALVRALQSHRLGGAGLDVTDPEPLPADHPLWGLPNVIITPHSGGDSDGQQERLWQLFEENLRRFAAGDRLLSVVDKARGY